MTTDKRIITRITNRCKNHLEKELKTDDETTIALGITMRLLVIQMEIGGYLEACSDSGVITEIDKIEMYEKICDDIQKRILACKTKPAGA